jgi:hypothetical protein
MKEQLVEPAGPLPEELDSGMLGKVVGGIFPDGGTDGPPDCGCPPRR